jgi:predicted anti-sigma-YlaC factor YlaD
MRCDDVRLAVSAILDDEALPDGVAPEAVRAHLAGCANCLAWRAGAERVTRAVRIRPAEVPDLTATILAAVRADGTLTGPAPARRHEPGRSRLRVGLRWALGILAVAQLMLAVPDLLGAVGHEAHAGREVAAFDIALAVGLLVAACYPEYARVLAPVVMTLVVCFAMISALDILQGIVTPGRVAVHALAVVQAGLVWVLARGGQARPVAVG